MKKKNWIGIYNLEPKYFNLALEKIKIFYQNREIKDYYPLWHDEYEKIYASSIFFFLISQK